MPTRLPAVADTVDLAALGQRIHVIGNSGCGKSTLGAELAELLGVAFVELDALNWEPNWVGLNATDPERFLERIRAATAADGWVVAGSYSGFSERGFWPRLDTVVWIDLPIPVLLWRVLRRSWRRWRSRELLWGTNYERFFPQFKVWEKDRSLVWWIVTQQARKRRNMLSRVGDPRWRHIRFVRLGSRGEVAAFRQRLGLARLPVAGGRSATV